MRIQEDEYSAVAMDDARKRQFQLFCKSGIDKRNGVIRYDSNLVSMSTGRGMAHTGGLPAKCGTMKTGVGLGPRPGLLHLSP